MTERYLRIAPSGDISWINIDRVPYSWTDGDGMSLDQIYAALGCDCYEQVSTILPGIVILIDECGKIKYPPRSHNALASRLYRGYLCGYDDIVGPALVCAVRRVEPYGELDYFPLNSFDLTRLSLALGVRIPAGGDR